MRRAALSLILLALTGCLDSLFETLPSELPFPTGASFAFVSTTYRDVPVQVGTIDVLAAEAGRFTGTWELTWSPGSDSTIYPGLHGGRGTVEGTIFGSEAAIDLVGGDPVGTIHLGAIPDSLGWSGGWNYRPDSTVRRGGRFTARMLP
jgi:hypothetical protein